MSLLPWHDDVLCFVEVKARRDGRQGGPLEAVTRQKISRIIAAARAFLEDLPEPWPLMRFDVLGIWLREPPEFILCQGAFEA